MSVDAVGVQQKGFLCEPVSLSPVVDVVPGGTGWSAPRQVGSGREAIGATATVARTASGIGFPVVQGIPMMMRPEALTPFGTEPFAVDVGVPPYDEAYLEAELYSRLAENELGRRSDAEILRILNAEPETFPDPASAWTNGGSTAGAYDAAMRHLAPVSGTVVLQIGGIGTHALRLLHAGAAHAIVVSPVVGELVEGAALARRHGFGDRVTFVGGLAEELPIHSGVIDIAYSGSSLHHTITGRSFPEIGRVLKTGERWHR